MQGEAEHAGDQRDEPVAGRAAAGHRGLGRGELAPGALAALRGPRGRPHHQRPRPLQVRHAGAPRGRSRLRLGLLRKQIVHTLLRQNRYLSYLFF